MKVTPVQTVPMSPKERIERLRGMTLAEQSALFAEVAPAVQQALVSVLRLDEIVDILDHMDPSQAQRVLSGVKDESYRIKIIKRLKSEAREKIEYFLRFHPKATMSLISFNYIILSSKATIAQAAVSMEEHYEDTGKFPEVLVQEKGVLVGEVPMATLVRERNTSLLKKFIVPIDTISYQREVIEIIETLTTTARKKIVVLDHDESVLGLVYAEDARALFGKLPADTLYDVSGVEDSARPFDSVLQKFQQRYRWLTFNLATAFLAGSMIFIFKETIDRLVILAMYIPIVAGMGGNAASQAFAVMLRGLTLGTVSMRNGAPAVWREVGAGALNGLFIGIIVAVISVLWNHSALLGLVVGLTMFGVHIVAGFLGAFVPLILKHTGKDPATLSTIIMSTGTDLTGLFLLLGLGSWLLI